MELPYKVSHRYVDIIVLPVNLYCCSYIVHISYIVLYLNTLAIAVWPELEMGVLYSHPIFELWSITLRVVELMTQNLDPHKINDRKALYKNQTMVQSQVELQSCKVE